MKIIVSIIDHIGIEHLIQNSNRTISVSPDNIGFVASLDGAIVGFSMLRVNDNVATIMVLNVYNEYRRRGIGKQLLSEILKYSNETKLKLVVKFESQKQNINDMTIFYRSQGYDKITLDDTEFIVNIEDWNLIFNSKYTEDKNYFYKPYSDLTGDEIQKIASLYVNNDLFRSIQPYCYKNIYNNSNSIYITDYNENVYGWAVAEVSQNVLNVYCAYIVADFRCLGVWINLLQYMSSSLYLKSLERKVSQVKFCVSSDNIIMNRFINVLLKEIDHIAINSYVITLKN